MKSQVAAGDYIMRRSNVVYNLRQYQVTTINNIQVENNY